MKFAAPSMARDQAVFQQPVGRVLWGILAVAFLVPAAPARAEIINRVAALVDDEVITVFEVEITSRPLVSAYLSQSAEDSGTDRISRIQQIKKDTLRNMIEQKLLEREVTRLGIPVEEQDIDNHIQKILTGNRMTREQLSEALVREGKTMKEFRENIRKRILADQYVRFRLKDRIRISEEDARAYYQQHQDEFISDTKITLAEIRFNLPAEADMEMVRAVFDHAASTYESLLAGADFEETARKVSRGKAAADGGALGEFLLETELKKTYRRAAIDLEPGQISTVFRDTSGFFILKCLDRSPSGPRPFEEVREKIMMKLHNEATERQMGKLAQELYKKSFVDIKVEEF